LGILKMSPAGPGRLARILYKKKSGNEVIPPQSRLSPCLGLDGIGGDEGFQGRGALFLGHQGVPVNGTESREIKLAAERTNGRAVPAWSSTHHQKEVLS
jgi:hypothetical protein